jgi:molybdopterin-binding protein
MKFGARNQLIGKVKAIKTGDLMSIAKFEIPAKSLMASVMTTESLEEMGLKKGDKVRVVVKAIHVLLVKD